jgi:hypothetical protein
MHCSFANHSPTACTPTADPAVPCAPAYNTVVGALEDAIDDLICAKPLRLE